MYNPKSHKAEEFINHEEVLETLEYAEKNKINIGVLDKILEKATELFCLLLCIYQITVSTAVYTVHTTIKTNISPDENSLKKKSEMK